MLLGKVLMLTSLATSRAFSPALSRAFTRSAVAMKSTPVGVEEKDMPMVSQFVVFPWLKSFCVMSAVVGGVTVYSVADT